MKHFVFGFCAVLFLTFGPVRVVHAQYRWGHSGPGPRGAGADKINWWTSSWNYKWRWPHFREVQLEKPTPLYTSPKSVGWWHKSPAPMGAGADKINWWTSSWDYNWTRPHIRKAQLEKPTPLYTTPKSVGWWYKNPGPVGASSGEVEK